jgi:hypothetical protein
MAGERAAPLSGHAVTPSRSRRPIDHQLPDNAICEIGRPLRAEGATRATWTSADPPSRWLAGLSSDDPVLGGRLGRGHRAAQPAAVITPRRPTIPFHCWQRWRQEMRTTTQAASGSAGAGHGGGADRRLGVGAGRPPRRGRVTRTPRPAGGCARALTSCSALVAGHWRPAQAATGYHRHLETAIASTRPASW